MEALRIDVMECLQPGVWNKVANNGCGELAQRSDRLEKQVEFTGYADGHMHGEEEFSQARDSCVEALPSEVCGHE